jgi:hypothetical protein
VQERIGGGSYSTVKRYLDEWKAQRQSRQQEAVELPKEIVIRGSEFIGSLWARAATLAEERLDLAREASLVAMSTIKSHVNHIFGTLGARNRVEAVRRAQELNLLT